MSKVTSLCSVIEDVVLVFLYFFGLIIPVFSTTSLLLLFVLPIRFLFEKGCFLISRKILFSRYITRIIISYLILGLYIYVNVTLHLTFDYTLLPTLFNVILHLIVGIFIISLFIHKRRDVSYVQNVIVGVFVLQSIIQIAAFIFPPVHSFVQLFQSESTIARADLFAGRKGLALAGTVFFGLSTIYGSSFFFLVKQCIDKVSFKIKDVIIGIVLMLGAFFTGRTFFVGMGISGLYFIASSYPVFKKLSAVFKILLIVFLSVLIIISVMPEEIYIKVYNLILYVFEALFNYGSTGTLTTTSTSKLFGEMYFPIQLSTLFLGDGLYEGIGGGYYMNTDAGYMRAILYVGILGLILSIIPDLLLMWGHENLRNSTISTFSVFMLIYMGVLHLKGEVFGYLITFHCVLFLYYIFTVFSVKFSKAQQYGR